MRTKFKNIVMNLLALTLLLTPAVSITASNIPSYAYYDQFPYIIVLQEGEQPRELTDEEFYNTAAQIIFPVNRYDLPLNSPLLRQLEQAVIPQINSDSLRLVRMVFRGAASPEGPVSVNERLGRQRVQAVYDFFASRIKGNAPSSTTASGAPSTATAPAGFPAGFPVSIDTDIEDYRSLLIMMRQAADPDYAVVKALCDLHLPKKEYALLKQKLQKNDGGLLWQRLLRQYFPDLRAARFVIYLQKVPKPIEPIATIAPIDTIATIAPIATIDTLHRREFLSVKTNVLFYGVYMPGYNRWCPIPNIAIEYYPLKGHFTFGASFDCPWWQDYDAHKYFQVRNYQLETRYYLKPSEPYNPQMAQSPQKPAFSGWYLQGYAHMGLFGICFDADRGWVGEGIGAGIGVGYVLPIFRNGHWRLEFQLQAGWFGCKYDPYKYENPVDPTYHDDLYYYKWTLSPSLFKKRQYRFNWFGPTRIGITLTYDLLYRRIQKRGVSFKNYEVVESYYPQTPQSPQKPQSPQNPQSPQSPQSPQLSQERRTAE